MPSTKQITFVFTQPPYGNNRARDGLDALLAYAAFDQKLQVVFAGDGCWLPLEQQNTDLLQVKNLQKVQGLLAMYDIDQLFIVQEDLESRNITLDSLIDNVKPITLPAFRNLLSQSDQVLTF